MNDHFTIVGTIRIEPRPEPRRIAALDDSTLERLFLGLAVCETLDQLPGRLTQRRSKSRGSSRQRTMLLRADLGALAAELQSEWEELEAAEH